VNVVFGAVPIKKKIEAATRTTPKQIVSTRLADSEASTTVQYGLHCGPLLIKRKEREREKVG